MKSSDATVGILADRNMEAYLELFAWFRANPQLGRITARTRLADIPAAPASIGIKFGFPTYTRAEVDALVAKYGIEHPEDAVRRLGLALPASESNQD